ncbi:deoxycytidylate deaminase [Yasminevirus sp. GU-2018]|uniref:Deoxycytidylate deaminase n=1 Tax=Yasminevirus sp. GU-2018 TaxID=2420051 RepID=A0A5K0U717_9VIRU|nr:deoxycytidylate deaminase [Yasminevirus sp. GU-2018]
MDPTSTSSPASSLILIPSMSDVPNKTDDQKSQQSLDLSITMSNGQKVLMKRSKAIKYYKLTEFFANTFSKDPSTKVGAVFLYPGTLQVLSMGYNGMPRNVDETIAERWERPLKYKFTEHAERNAIYNAAQSGTPLRDSICVASMCPCADCARGVIQSGCKMVITRDVDELQRENPDVVSRWKPEWDVSIGMMQEAGVQIMFLTKAELL